MHNCKATKARFTEVALNGPHACLDDILAAQLRGCADCREEYAALKHDLDAAINVMDMVAPPEEYWVAYRERLRRELSESTLQHLKTAEPAFWSRAIVIFSTSVRVPVPALAVFALVVIAGLIAATKTSRDGSPTPQGAPAVVYVPVEVPKVEEKIITRVVYQERKRLPSARKINRQSEPPNEMPALASRRRESPPLAGFKPLDEIKLTVIKGGYQNEK